MSGDRPTIQERYVKSTKSSNLMDDETHNATLLLQGVALSRGLTPIEINGQTFSAIGKMVGGIGWLLLRVKLGLDATSYPQLLEEWVARVTRSADIRHWPTQIKPRKVAITALDHWFNNICRGCGGHKFQHSPDNVQVLTSKTCDVCDGTGMQPLQCPNEIRRYVIEVVDELDDIDRMLGINTSKKIYGGKKQ